MASTASIIIEVDDTAAVGALNRVKAEAAAIGPAIAPVQQVSTRAFSQVVQDTQKARESTMLLRDEFGIAIPRALRSTIAEASLIGPLMTTAFSGLAVLAFVQIAENAGKQLAAWIGDLMGWTAQAKETMDAQIALNNTIIATNEKVASLNETYRLIGLQGLPLISEKQKIAGEELTALKTKASELTAALAALNKQATETETVTKNITIGRAVIPETITQPTAAALKAQADIPGMVNQLAEVQSHINEAAAGTRNLGKEFSTTFSDEQKKKIQEMADAALAFATAQQEAIAKVMAMTSAATTAMAGPEEQISIELRAKQEELAKFLTYYGQDETMRRQAALASVAIEKEASTKRIQLATDEADAKLKSLQDEEDQEVKDRQAYAEKVRRMEDETINIERIAAVGMAPPWERANAAIVASYQERMAKIAELVRTGDLDEQHAARMQTAAMQELYAQQRDLLATQMETLYNDITSGNIGKAFLAMFKKMVFETVATWILGMQGMRAVSQQAMGTGAGGTGILGAIFGGGAGGGSMGGIFGGAGGGGGQGGISSIPGVITNLFGGGGGGGGLITGLPTELSAGAMSMAPLVGVGLSAGMGVGLGTTLPSGGSAIAGAAGLSGIFAKLFKNAPVIGGVNLGPMMATLGIGIVGSLFGKGGVLGVLGSAAGGALAGAAFGPVGAVIGGIVGGLVGLFSSIFGQHKGDKARIQVMEPLIAQIKILKDSYDVFQTTYDAGVTQLETLRANAIAALHQIGGHQVSGNTASTNKLINDAEAYLKTTEAGRAMRAQIAFGPPQFRMGGLVGPGAGGAVPSWFAGSAMSFGYGGAVPAFLHAGEFVMRPEAVQRYGAGNLARMNAGGASGDVHVTVNLSAWDGKSVEEWLSSGGIEMIDREFRRGINSGKF